VPLLKIVINKNEVSFREAGLIALLAIDPEHILILPYLERLPDNSPRLAILETLRKIGPSARSLRLKLQELWGTVQSLPPLPLPHTDGPDRSTNTFWFRGKAYKIAQTPYEVLCYIWDKESVLIEEIDNEVWETSERSDDRIKSALRRINRVLEEAEVPFVFTKNRDRIERG
jgi:hypothetical protein